MAWSLTKADQDALSNVNIKFYSGLTLDSSNLQFPPKITKDHKKGNFEGQNLTAFEPLPKYLGAESRGISLEFQWVMGGDFTPEKVHNTISQIKEYYYKAFLAVGNSGNGKFPLVTITKFYGIITTQSTWRMTNVSVSYSEELVKIDGKWYPLHVKVTIDLESTTQIKGPKGDKTLTANGPLEKPDLTWY